MRKHSLIPVWLCAVVCLLLLASGCVISPRRTFGQIGPTPTPTPTATPTPINSPTPTPTPVGAATGKLYVSNSAGNSILRFDDAFTASGNVVPAATITGGLTTLNAPAFIALDAVADRLYVANSSDASVLVFDSISTKNGNQAPDRTISGPLVTPTDVSIDTTKDLLYVADDADILVFASASTATGNATPVQDLTVSFTISAIFIDAAHDRLYVADAADNAIDVFDNASTLPTGNVRARTFALEQVIAPKAFSRREVTVDRRLRFGSPPARSRFLIALQSRVGSWALSNAATPATIGAAIEVPESKP